MEKFIYNTNKLSLKDSAKFLDISQKKWNAMFDFFLNRTSSIYFRGSRLEFKSPELSRNIDLLVDGNTLLFDEKYVKIAFKVKIGSVLHGRGLIRDLWNHYEYPCIILLKKELNLNEFQRLFSARFYEDFFDLIIDGYLIYKSFEPDVLWIEKTSDMDFPDFAAT